MVDGGTYAECECEFRANYCNLYYEFEESTESCAIAACCEETEDKKKHTCIPELMPTTTPSAAPSQSDPPTTVSKSFASLQYFRTQCKQILLFDRVLDVMFCFV